MSVFIAGATMKGLSKSQARPIDVFKFVREILVREVQGDCHRYHWKVSQGC